MIGRNNILKPFFAVAFTAALIFQVSKDATVMLWYQINKDSLTEQYCINIEDPEKMCKAQCYIFQFIADSDANTDEFSQAISLRISEYIVNNNSIDIMKNDINVIENLFVYAHYYNYDYLSQIDHPPRV